MIGDRHLLPTTSTNLAPDYRNYEAQLRLTLRESRQAHWTGCPSMNCVTLTGQLTPASDEPRWYTVSQILQFRHTQYNRLIRNTTGGRFSQKLRLSSPQMPRCRAAPPRIGAVLASH
jgi:hypothetical protein